MDLDKPVQEGRDGTGIPALIGEAAYLQFKGRSTMDLVQPVQEGCDGTGIPARVGETALLAKQVTQPSYLDPPKKYLKI